MADILYIVMPAYNEAENIEKVIEQWYPLLQDKDELSRIIVADYGSSDKTHEILCLLQSKYNKLEILTESKKEHGPKLIALYNYAINSGADYVFQTDSDGQTDPNEFISFWENRKNYDAIIGNRTRRGDGFGRYVVEKIVCLLLLLFFRIKVPDANAPFRLMNTLVLKKYLSRIPYDYNIPNIIIVTYLAKFKENICFKEITFQPRMAGKNTINFGKIFKIGIKAVKDFVYFKKDMRLKK